MVKAFLAESEVDVLNVCMVTGEMLIGLKAKDYKYSVISDDTLMMDK